MTAWLTGLLWPSLKITSLYRSVFAVLFAVLFSALPSNYAFAQASVSSCPATMLLSSVGNGVAVNDNATGSGWILWTEQNVFSRFSPSPHSQNADHLIAVQFMNGQWYFDNNGGLHPFVPASSDCLIAEVNFDSDIVKLLENTDDEIQGIDSGYDSGDLSIVANRWANQFNAGEFGVAGNAINKTDGSTSPTGPVNVNNSTCPATISIGDVGNGIAASDNATGEGWLLWSTENIFTRFNPEPHPQNAKHLIAVKYLGGQWFVDNNIGLTAFTPAASDCLLASVNFSTDSVTLLEDTKMVVEGIDAGYASGNLSIVANQWASNNNAGEFGVIGTSVNQTSGSTTTPTTAAACPASMPLGNVGDGIAASDHAVGSGWILWSEQSVFSRFSPAPHPQNSDHLIAVRFVDGQWYYDNNNGLKPFTPKLNDCLIASVNFVSDSVSLLAGTDATINGISSGYSSGNLVISPNIWNNVSNAGEFGIIGSSINKITTPVASCPAAISLGSLGKGIAANDSATGTGWVMWSEQRVFSRFQPVPHPENADHLIAVRFVNGQWYYDNNGGLNSFVPAANDCLVASVNFSTDTVNMLTGVDTIIHGIASGYATGNLAISANIWGGVSNAGEFGISGTLLSKPLPNISPIANAGADQVVQLGQVVELDGRVSSDEDGDIVSWAWLEDAGQSLGSSDTLTWTPTDIGLYTISLIVTDDDGDTDIASVVVEVTEPQIPSIPQIDDYQLIFGDEFTGSVLDNSVWDTSLLWGPYLTINNEEQLYVDTLGMHSSFAHTPFTLTGDTLKITASKVTEILQPPVRPSANSPDWKPNSYSEYVQNRTVGSPGDANYSPGYDAEDVNYLSGIITSYGTFSMTHGYVEMRAKLPAGAGLWPAFWMLPQHWVEDVPEIDVMEFLGQDVDRLYNTYHYFDVENNWAQISTPSMQVFSDDWTQRFHTFGVAWSPTEIVWYVNGEETHRVSDANYDIANQPMHLIANLAVGGNWPGSPDANTAFPAEFEIDYIRAYKKKLNPVLDLANDYQLMFNDEFAGTTLDASKWNTHFLWGPYLPINNEDQYYVDALGSDAGGESPFSLANGVLSITARAADDPAGFTIPEALPASNDSIWTAFPNFQQNLGYSAPDYTSGIITSYDSFKFAHGYAEIRAKIPAGDGLWPAFWLLNGYYVGQQPEIDIMEVRGENPSEIVHSYHYQNPALVSQSFTTQHPDAQSDYSDDFHTYGVRWQPGKITWYIDGVAVHTLVSDTVAYQVMYVIANLAVGGDFNYVATDTSLFPSSFDIDYIRVYQEVGN